MYFTVVSPRMCHIYQILDLPEVDPEERTHGPLRYNVATGKLTFGDSYHYKPDAEGLERLVGDGVGMKNIPIWRGSYIGIIYVVYTTQ